MAENCINAKDYIKEDGAEQILKEANYDAFMIEQESHRGISRGKNGKIQISTRELARYVLRRIDLVRLEKTGRRIIKNQVTHCYETVTDTILTAICMFIMDEYDPSVYESVAEKRLLTFIDKEAETYRKMPTDDKFILFPNGVYCTADFSFDDMFQTKAVMTYQMSFPFVEGADCPEWKKALHKMFPVERETFVAIIQEMFGYTFLYGKAPADTLFYLYGGGRNGKSIISNTLIALHGKENIAGVSLAELSDRFSLSAVWGKKVCICSENPQEKLLNTSTMKALTGRDPIKIEQKYETPFTDSLTTKIIVSSNHLLRTDDDSVGFWERILPIPFEVTFLSKEEIQKRGKNPNNRLRDTNLEAKLKKELSGIFCWSMEGLKRLQSNNWVFTKSERIETLKQEMMMYSKPVTIFVKQCVKQGNLLKQQGKRDSIRSSEVHQKFLAWAESNSLEVTKFNNARAFRNEFTDSLKECGIAVKVIKNSVDYYKGIIVELPQ